MPQLWSPAFLRNVPLPLLQIYSLTSCILLCCALYQAVAVVTGAGPPQRTYDEPPAGVDEGGDALDAWQSHMNKYLTLNSSDGRLSEHSHRLIAQSVPLKLLFYLVTEPLCCCIVLNAVCCFIITCTNFARWLVFGKLRTSEMMQLHDRFWNFAIFKFAVICGVLNVQDAAEVMLWVLWFVLVGCLYYLTLLAQDRIKYMVSTASSAAGRRQLYRTLLLMAGCCACACALLGVAFCMATTLGTNYGALLAADALTLWVRSVYGALRYAAVLYEQGRERNLRRMEFVYYADLCFTLATLLIEFVHLLHMLIWSNIVLSVVSLVIGVQLRQIWSEIDSCLRRHRNHRRVMAHLNRRYPIASRRELGTLDDDTCAICWEALLDSARKLPCSHIFHHWCLQSWLEQDHSCPTCRVALAIDPRPNNANEEQADAGAVAQPQPQQQQQNNNNNNNNNHFQHFFEFDGRRFSRWLPTFRVQVSHNLGQIFARLGHPLPQPGPLPDSQYNQWTAQVREMFPHVPAHLIEADLRLTNHVNLTVENIIEERIWVHEQAEPALGDDTDDGEDDDDDADDGGGAHGDEGGTSDDDDGGGGAHDEPAAHTGGNAMQAFAERLAPAGSAQPAPRVDRSSPASVDRVPFASVPSTSSAGPAFAVSADERQSSLADSKRRMVDVNRRRYLLSVRAADLRAERDYWLGDDYGARRPAAATAAAVHAATAGSSRQTPGDGGDSATGARQRRHVESSVQRLL